MDQTFNCTKTTILCEIKYVTVTHKPIFDHVCYEESVF